MDLILHTVIVLNVFHHLAMLPGHEASFKNHKNGFFNDPMKDQKKHLRILMSTINETVIIQRQDTEVEICDAVTLQFSTSVEVRVLIPSVVRLSLVTTFPG